MDPLSEKIVRAGLAFCGARKWAYVWSLAGSGKRCPCGTLHGLLGSTKKLDDVETPTNR